MPTVPVIQDTQQLDTRTGRQRIQADPDAFGAQEARGLQVIGKGLDSVRVAAEEIDDNYNEANARELDNQLSARIRDRLYNTESGYLSTQRGRNALDNRAQVESDIDAVAAELLPQARNPRAAAMYQDVARRRVADALGTVATYAARENVTYQNEVSEASINEALDNAVAAFDDPAQVAANRDTILAELQTLSRRNGWDETVLSQRIRQFQSDLSTRVVVQLAATDPTAAQEYFAQIAPTLTAQDRAELGTTMRAAIRQGEDDIIDQAWVYVSEGRPIPGDLWASVPGRARIDIQNERRRRAEGGSGEGNPLTIAEFDVMSNEEFARLDLMAVRSELGSSFSRMAARQRAVREGSVSADVTAQRTTFNAVRDTAANALNIDLTPTEGMGDDDRLRATVFNQALWREVEAYTAANPGGGIDGPTAQILIGRAYVQMRGSNFTREQGQVPRQGRGSRRASAPTEVVVPYRSIPRDIAVQIGTRLQRQLGRTPTEGEVEGAYARYVQSEEAIDIGGGQ